VSVRWAGYRVLRFVLGWDDPFSMRRDGPRAYEGLDPVRQRPVMDGNVAVVADDECFPPAGGHDLLPDRWHSASWDSEVFKFPDVVDIDPVVRPADFTHIGEEASGQLVLLADVVLWGRSICDRGELVGFERHVAEECSILLARLRVGFGRLED